MRYPKTGGFKSFLKPLISSADIRNNYHCIKVDLSKKELTFSNGKIIIYKHLVSTLPLPEIVRICNTTDEKVIASSKKLVATSIDLVSIGFNKIITKDLWFYIYDEDIYASRAYSPSIKSPENAPKNCSSLQFEVYSRGVDSKFSAEELKANTLTALKRMNLASPEDIKVYDHRRVRYGNVVFDVGMESNREVVLKWCNDNAIHSCGRFGSWDYFWSHDSFLSGYESLNEI